VESVLGAFETIEIIRKQHLSGFGSVWMLLVFFCQKMPSVSFRHATLSTGLRVALLTPTTKLCHGFRSTSATTTHGLRNAPWKVR
jgi:hypothetical protein